MRNFFRKTAACGEKFVKYFTQGRRNKENVRKKKPVIKRIFILSGSLPLHMTQVVKTLGSTLLLSLMDDDVSEINK